MRHFFICNQKENFIIETRRISRLLDGARRNKVEEPLLFGTEYEVQWRESRVNLAELAKLRWIDGWSRKELAKRYGRTEEAVQNYFQIIKKKGF